MAYSTAGEGHSGVRSSGTKFQRYEKTSGAASGHFTSPTPQIDGGASVAMGSPMADVRRAKRGLKRKRGR